MCVIVKVYALLSIIFTYYILETRCRICQRLPFFVAFFLFLEHKLWWPVFNSLVSGFVFLAQAKECFLEIRIEI